MRVPKLIPKKSFWIAVVGLCIAATAVFLVSRSTNEPDITTQAAKYSAPYASGWGYQWLSNEEIFSIVNDRVLGRDVSAYDIKTQLTRRFPVLNARLNEIGADSWVLSHDGQSLFSSKILSNGHQTTWVIPLPSPETNDILKVVRPFHCHRIFPIKQGRCIEVFHQPDGFWAAIRKLNNEPELKFQLDKSKDVLGGWKALGVSENHFLIWLDRSVSSKNCFDIVKWDFSSNPPTAKKHKLQLPPQTEFNGAWTSPENDQLLLRLRRTSRIPDVIFSKTFPYLKLRPKGPEGLLYVSQNDGLNLRLLGRLPMGVGQLQWLPHGKAISFIDHSANRPDLWILPVEADQQK